MCKPNYKNFKSGVGEATMDSLHDNRCGLVREQDIFWILVNGF